MKKKIYLNTLKDEEVVERLKNGEVIHMEGCNCKIKMMEGVIVTKFKDVTQFGMGFAVYSVNTFYFEEEEPFEITQPGFYKTRDGRKAYVYCINNESLYPVKFVIENFTRNFEATQFGFLTDGNCECFDLVSKWDD